MNPLFQRISTVEAELSDLRKKAKSLSVVVAELKKEASEEGPMEKSVCLPPVTRPVTRPAEKPVPLPEPHPIKVAKVTIKPENSVTHEEVAGFEMELGRVWFVRLGILLLTTGFVFLSRYTYDNFVRELGPGIRLVMMYLFSFTLTGLGLFCERWKDSLKSYGRIVAAGGLAAIFYCGFAAHNVEALRVIESPVLASIVLTISAGLFCAVSLWRKSRVMLSTSLGLAFYSISVNPIGWMACLSALILASLGVIMMVRYRWVEVGFVVLIGSYLSHTWWQFAISQGDNPVARWFLPAYWILFAAAALLAHREMAEERHSLFTSVNNGAFFFLFSFHLESGQWMEKHWLFCFIFGAAILGIALLAKSRLPEQTRILHLAKGTGLITLGLALLLNGHQLFIALLIEAIVLMVLNLRKKNDLFIAAAWAVGILSCLALSGSSPQEIPKVAFFFGTIAWLAFGSLHRYLDLAEDPSLSNLGGTIAALISAGFLSFGVMQNWTDLDRALVLASIGFLTAVASLFRKPRTYAFDSLVVYQFTGIIALASIFALFQPSQAALLTAAGLSLAISATTFLHWKNTDLPEEKHAFHLTTGLLTAMALGFVWLVLAQSNLTDFSKVALVLLIPLIGTAIARSSGMLAHSLVPFAMHLALLALNLQNPATLAVGLAITMIHFEFMRRFHRMNGRGVLLTLLFLLGAVLWGFWLLEVFAHPSLPLVLTGVVLLVAGEVKKPRLMTATSVPFLFLGLAVALFLNTTGELYLCLVAPILLHLARTFAEAKIKFQTLAVTCLLLLWLQITRDAYPLPLAAVWAVTGTSILLTGLGLKSRCFRLVGLVILAFSLGHLMLIDLTKLDPLPRILSFKTLGIGLLGLGFVYNRYQDRLKQIL